MSVKIINENLKSESFSTLYYIYGEEEYLKNYYFSQLKAKIVTELVEFNVTEFDGKNFDFIDFSNAVNSYPVMTDRKVVTVVDFDNSLLKKDFTKEFALLLQNIPEFCTVVFFDSQLKNITPSNPLLKVVSSANGVCAEVKRPDHTSLSRWVMRHFKSFGKNVSAEDIDYLIDISDSDMMSLENEIIKICNFSTGNLISRTDIDSVVTRSIDTNRYEIADAFCSKNYTKIFEIVDKLYKQNVDDIVIANVFYRVFSDMWKAKICFCSGKAHQDLARDFQINPYAAMKISKNAKGLSKSFLQQALSLSLQLDAELKSSPFDNKGLIITYIGNLINYRIKDEKTEN